MQKELNTQDAELLKAAITQSEPDQKTTQDTPNIKRNGLKDQFKKKGEEMDEQQKPPMSKQDTVKFYEENLPFMRLQDEYEELIYRFNERKVRTLETQVRELEAIGFLGQWKAQQDEAKRRHDTEQKMKDEWEAMTPEEREEYKKKAQANLRIMELQAKGLVIYDGKNAGDILSFVTGESNSGYDTQEGRFCFQIPDGQGGFTELCIVPGQTLSRTEAGEFTVS